MRVLVALARLTLGGTQTYSATVAEQLERLGHSVTTYAPEADDDGRKLFACRGLRFAVGHAPDSSGFDAALVQDSGSAYALAAQREGLRQIFVIHGFAAFEHPAAALHPSPPIVVLNDRVARRAAVTASQPEIVRLRQPIDVERFRPRAGARKRARRVLMLSNYVHGAKLDMLEGVCSGLGLELVRLGAGGERKVAPEAALADADIVLGYGRSVLEGMAMGRAAYVWDYAGGDGWVTPETYAALESDGFAGAATEDVIDADRMRDDFAAYTSDLGDFGFELVSKHHSATDHSEALVDLLGRAASPQSDDVLETLGLLVRAECRATFRSSGFEYQVRVLQEEREAERARAEAERARAEAERARAEAAEAQLAALTRSRSWRLTAPLRRARLASRRR